ncbi:hypothetical protein TL16_g00117 [Triparma laevis f. inornata]|uniref:Chlorophyllase n=1 Tax=Triparma laevis f. inornata TaxID=1714386 RepID=A0A9W6Z3T2_9STRA|nr:hypothetical protein TL16_g00117 [Triparma laevis f. inornata]
MRAVILLFTALAFAASEVSKFEDCDETRDKAVGPFGSPEFFSEVTNGTTVFSLIPEASAPVPLIAFMHGSTGQYQFYNDSLSLIASHGFAVVFPFVKSPEKDKSPLTTNTDGRYLIKAIQYAKEQNSNQSSIFFNKIDTTKIIIAGHSMGATCSINAANTLRDEGIVLDIAMHPGICGPFGPPPCPSCWKSATLLSVAEAMPVVFTTATNDGAFWPAPHTAEHEYGCFKKSVGDIENKNEVNIKNAAFIQFNAQVCEQDGEREPVVKDGGHNCPMKRIGGGYPEFSAVLTAAKLYGHLDGDQDSQCYEQLYGESGIKFQNITGVLDFRLELE